MNKSLFYGGISGIVESCFSHPIDFYKIKYQESIFNNKPKPHIIPFLINNVKSNGFLSLYKGFVPKIASIIPARTTFWGIQDICINNINIKNPKYKYVSSGLIAGFCQTIIETPAEVAKIQLMTNQTINMTIIKSSFNGFKWNTIRNSLFCATICLSNNYYQSDDKFLKFMVNGTSAFLACILTQPIDFMKTKYQINDNSFELSIFKAVKEYKLKMFSGALARAYVGAINMGVGALVFNYLMDNQLF